MAYDETLAHRVRELLAGEDDLSELAMFGGLAFLLAGNIAVVVSGSGGLMVRVGRANEERALADPRALPVTMGARRMRGWVRVPEDALRQRRALERWVRDGARQARSLPPKG